MGRDETNKYGLQLILLLCIIFYGMSNGSPALADRTCNDIRCLASEVCVMEQGQCDYTGRCHRYPTCRLSKGTPLGSCEHVRCPPGQFCSLIEDRCSWKPCPSRPTCISTNNSVSRGGYRVTQRPW